jgi:hypothetical protein
VERHDEHLFCEKVVGGSKFWRKWRGVLVMPLHVGDIAGLPLSLQTRDYPELFNSFRFAAVLSGTRCGFEYFP